MTSRKHIYIAIALNALVLVLEIAAFSHSIAIHGPLENFVYYTQCSNLIGAVACALCAIAEIRALKSPGDCTYTLPRPLCWLKYCACCCLLMTFVVVIAVLAPMLESIDMPGYYLMFVEGSKPVTHLIGPVLVCITYILFEGDRTMTLRQSLCGLAFTFVYACVAYTCNALRLWDGPYPFFQVWNMPPWMTVVWFIALFVLAFVLCQIPRLLARKMAR